MKRKANYELLRIVSMMMIVCLHLLDKGGLLTPYGADQSNLSDMTVFEHLRWLLEALCVMSVNAYILVSGFWGYESRKNTLLKAACLWGRVLFYSVGICLVALLAGVCLRSDLTGSDWIAMLFPASADVYWFATCYLVVLLLRPILNAGVAALEQKQFRSVLIVFFVALSAVNTFVPYQFPYDHAGHDPLWMIFVYLVGAYLGKYGFGILDRGWKALAGYVGMALGMWGMQLALAVVYGQTGKLGAFIHRSYQDNSVWALGGGIALLALFHGIRIREGLAAGIIRVIAEATFGIYLIHEHPLIRYKWQQWLGITEISADGFLLPHIAGCVITMFVICGAIELIRIYIMKAVCRKLPMKKGVRE